jgi:hypothetical protein
MRQPNTKETIMKTNESKNAMRAALGRGAKHVGNIVWTSIHVPEEGVRRDVLADALAKRGLPGLIPGEASEQAAFGRAVRSVQRAARDKDIVVERDQRFGRAVLLRVNRGVGKDKVTHTYAKACVDGDIVRFERGSMMATLSSAEDEASRGVEALLTHEYARQKGVMDHTELGAWLVESITKHANAVRVRDEGVIYFVPATYVKAFETIRDALREASPSSNAPSIIVRDDDESVGSIGSGVADSFEKEIADVIASLDAITSDGRRKTTTLSKRLTELSRISSRAMACEVILDARKSALLQRLNDAQHAIEKEIDMEAAE